MKTDKLLQLIQQKRVMRSGGALPLPKAQQGIVDYYFNTPKSPAKKEAQTGGCPTGWIKDPVTKKCIRDTSNMPKVNPEADRDPENVTDTYLYLTNQLTPAERLQYDIVLKLSRLRSEDPASPKSLFLDSMKEGVRQIGGQGGNPIEFEEHYWQSPTFLRRLSNFSNDQNQLNSAQKFFTENIKNAQIDYSDNPKAFSVTFGPYESDEDYLKNLNLFNLKKNYDEDKPTILISNKEAKDIGTTSEDILNHEKGHLRTLNPEEGYEFLNINSNLSEDDREKIKRVRDKYEGITPWEVADNLAHIRDPQDKKNTSHLLGPTENYSDLNVLRNLMYQNKIYDAASGDITLDILKNALDNPAVKNSFAVKRLLKSFTPEQIMYLNNKIADIGSSQILDMAMQGGALPKAQPGFSAQNKINQFLGNPMARADEAGNKVGEKWYNPQTKKWESEGRDNFRHPMAGRYVAEAITDKIPYFVPGRQLLGFLGSNALGVGHELIEPNRSSGYSWWGTIREGGEDAFNNMIGAGVGSLPLSDQQKTDMLLYLSDHNLIPDGYAQGNMYLKKQGGSLPRAQSGIPLWQQLTNQALTQNNATSVRDQVASTAHPQVSQAIIKKKQNEQEQKDIKTYGSVERANIARSIKNSKAAQSQSKIYQKEEDRHYNPEQEEYRDDTTLAPEGSTRATAQDYLNKANMFMGFGLNPAAKFVYDGFVSGPAQSAINLSNTAMGDRPIRGDEDVVNFGWDVANVAPFVGAAARGGKRLFNLGRNIFNVGNEIGMFKDAAGKFDITSAFRKKFEEAYRRSNLEKVANPKVNETFDNFITRINTPEGRKRLLDLGITNPEEFSKLNFVKDNHSFGYFSPGYNAIGLHPDIQNNIIRQVTRHEIEHAVQNLKHTSAWNKYNNDVANFKYLFRRKLGKQAREAALNEATQIDDLLADLELRKTPEKVDWDELYSKREKGPKDASKLPDYLSDKQRATNYFDSGSEGKEKSAFLAEVQQYMMNNNIIPSKSYVEITPKMVKQTFADAMFDERNGGKYLRLFNIMKPTEANYELVAKGLNKMLGVGVGVGVGAGMYQPQSLQKQREGGSLDKYQWKYGQVSPRDSVQNMAYNTMTYEANRGSGSGYGLSNFGNDALGYGASKGDAVNWYMNNIYPNPIISEFPTAMEKSAAGDFIYNAGRDPRTYMLDQYLKSIGQSGLPGRGSFNIDMNKNPNEWAKKKPELDALWNKYKAQIYKLSENDRRILLNNGRDFYYQNINTNADGSPSDAYWNTWYGRQHATDQYVPLTDADVTNTSNKKFYPVKKQDGGNSFLGDLGTVGSAFITNPVLFGNTDFLKLAGKSLWDNLVNGSYNDSETQAPTKEDKGFTDQQVSDIRTRNDYYNWLKYQENGVKKGWDPKLKVWMPYESPEKGLPTIGYGHKLTPEDVKSKRFEKGLTEQQAIDLMQNDFTSHFNQAITGYNDRFKKRNLKFDQLPYKQQLLIGDYVYNLGPDFFQEDTEKYSKAFPKFLNAIVDYNQAKSDKDRAKYRDIIAKQYHRGTGKKPNRTRNKGTVDFFLKDFGITPDMIDKSTYMAQGGQYLPMAQTGIPSDKIAQTPVKYDKPLKLADIKPVYHKNMVIDNYSPRANYLIQGDKVYMSDKGQDNWFDISDNTFAKRNLYGFLDDKYKMIGYSPEEKNILGLLNSNQYDYQQRFNPAPKKEEPKLEYLWSSGAPSTPKPKNVDPFYGYVKGNSAPKVADTKPSIFESIQSELSDIREDIEGKYGEITDVVDYYKNLGINYVKRNYKFYKGEDPDAVKINFDEAPNLKPLGTTDYYKKYDKSKIQLKEVDIPAVTQKTGQTLLGGNMDLDNVKFKVRNRGDYNTFKSDGMLITAFRPFLAPDQYKAASDNSTYFGVDANGKFVAGTFKDFKNRKDVLISQTFMNKVVSFDEKDGKSITKQDKDHGNNNFQVPIITALSDDEKITKKGSLNIMVRTNGDEDYFGSVEGGKFVMQNPDTKKTYFVMGSLKHVKEEFKKIKGNSKYVNVYATDNGSYSKGLSFKDKTFTPERLKEYDALNRGGVAGNALYLVGANATPSKYKNEYYQTNVRTEKDDSYKKGHPLKNEMKKIVLHWTAFKPSDDGSWDQANINLHNQYMTPGIEQNSHLVVLPNGTKRIYASPEQVTFHAGDSRLEGRDNVNDFSIGIEFQNAGNRYTDPRTGKTYAKPLTPEQVESAVEYIADILDTGGLKLKDIVTHKQIRDEYLNEYRGKRDKKGELIVNPKDERAKPDLDDYQYKQVIDALKARGYK